MKVCAMVAAAENGVIGLNNDLPWNLPNDLKYFKKTTSGYPIILGRKCFDSIGRPLPKRKNIILTRNLNYSQEKCTVVHSLASAYQEAILEKKEKVFILGGGEIYKMSEADWDVLYLTLVHADIKGDVYFDFPSFDDWNLVSDEAYPADEKHAYPYSFKVYSRKEKP